MFNHPVENFMALFISINTSHIPWENVKGVLVYPDFFKLALKLSMDHPTAWKRDKVKFLPQRSPNNPWMTHRTLKSNVQAIRQPTCYSTHNPPMTYPGVCLMREKPLIPVQNLPKIKCSMIRHMASETNVRFYMRHTLWWVINKRPNCPKQYTTTSLQPTPMHGRGNCTPGAEPGQQNRPLHGAKSQTRVENLLVRGGGGGQSKLGWANK